MDKNIQYRVRNNEIIGGMTIRKLQEKYNIAVTCFSYCPVGQDPKTTSNLVENYVPNLDLDFMVTEELLNNNNCTIDISGTNENVCAFEEAIRLPDGAITEYIGPPVEPVRIDW